MGEVWRAEDVVLSRAVAVKTLRSECSTDADRARFRAEARHAARLAHPGIASVYDFGETPERAWLVMELVDGEPLSSLLQREAPLDVDRTLDVVAQAAVALHAAHLGGVVHRDVKPGNLLLRPDGALKVTDFGIASAVDAPSLTQTGFVVGTAYYLSPEQAAGRSGSPASDLYSLGVVAYECLTGERPFPGDSAVSVALAHLQQPAPDLPDSAPPAVRELVARALAKRPEDRFPDAASMAAAALALRGGAPAAATGRVQVEGRVPVDSGPVAGCRAGSAGLSDTALVPVVRRVDPAARLRPTLGRAAVTSTLALLVRAGGGRRAALAARGRPAPTAVTTAARSRGADRGAGCFEGQPGEQVRDALLEQGPAARLAFDGVGTAVGTVSGWTRR
jgi:serine/threonine-protein kinase